jgi:methylenetetrahydrofolate reductase (NADPH)
MNSSVMNLERAPLTGRELKQRIVRFARTASTEISPHDEELLPALANRLPGGTTVYIAHTPKASLDDVVRIALKAEAVGFRASPHIVARRLESERALRNALRELRDGGVEQILLVAGDRDPPVGKFASTLEVLDTGATLDAGIMHLGVAGHPEGHKAVGPSTLWSALKHKQSFAERTGTKMHIVTQFGFNPEAVCAWDRHLAEAGISLPVHVGIAGPTPLPKLIKFAMQCGIGASMGALAKGMSALGHAAGLATSPDQMLIGLVRRCAAQSGTRLAQPHFYAFGGVMATARWMRGVIDGSFELKSNEERFVVNA